MATVVFADLVGSTGLFERLGDEAAGHLVRQLTGSLAKSFEHHHGRVVKLLGDGLLVVFPDEVNAVAACVAIQRRLRDQPVRGAGRDPVQVQMGIVAGEIVEIGGECYGDAVNSAARLADLAGGEQILTSGPVHDALPASARVAMRPLGPMYLRGKSEATEVYRIEWRDDADADADATVMGASAFPNAPAGLLELFVPGRTRLLESGHGKLTIGRSASVSLRIDDVRVSRVHAIVEWRGGNFVLSDTSSFGSWVYFGDQPEPVALRRTECFLVGQGEIALGCERGPGAPLVRFAVTA